MSLEYTVRYSLKNKMILSEFVLGWALSANQNRWRCNPQVVWQSLNDSYEKHMPPVRLELTTSASLYVYKYSALTDCATGAGWPSEDEKSKPRPGKYTDACLHAVFAVDLALSWWIIKNLKISENKISNVVT